MQIHYFCTSMKATTGYSKFNKFCYRINNMIINLLFFFPPSVSGNIIIIHLKNIYHSFREKARTRVHKRQSRSQKSINQLNWEKFLGMKYYNQLHRNNCRYVVNVIKLMREILKSAKLDFKYPQENTNMKVIHNEI